MSKKKILALLFGLAAGTATGVLFSPTSGKKFRKKIKEEALQQKQNTQSLYNHFKKIALNLKKETFPVVKSSLKNVTQSVEQSVTAPIKAPSKAKAKLQSKIKSKLPTKAKVKSKIKAKVKKMS